MLIESIEAYHPPYPVVLALTLGAAIPAQFLVSRPTGVSTILGVLHLRRVGTDGPEFRAQSQSAAHVGETKDDGLFSS